jgi:hypothetical protein
MRTLIAFAAALAFAGGALAQQYKWVDKDGRVRYGDVPPPGVKAKPLRAPAGPAAPAPSAAAKEEGKKPLTPAEQEAEFRRRRLEAQKEQEKQAKAAEADQAKQQHCANAKQQLAMLESGQRIASLDPRSGERTFLDDSQRATETARARKAVADWCT